MQADRIRVHRLAVPLVRPFRTSFGTEQVRDVLLIEASDADGRSGWGECVTMSWPGYSSEYTDAAVSMLRDHLVPALEGVDLEPESVRDALEVLRGHPMAKAALSTALLDLWLRQREVSLVDYLGGVRDLVDCGVSVGIPTSMEALMEEVAGYVEAGYRRVKLKIQPGWDLEPVAAVREMWPQLPLQVDANQAYARSHAQHLARLDPYRLLLIEQPLHEDDWLGHVQLARACGTPICLDESILSADSAEAALEFGAASIINIKPGRVGGYLAARDIHDVCAARGAPVWCGGMLETGIGRAANLALAALPGFSLPGDTSASSRYFARDVTAPFELEDGRLRVPRGHGIGVDPIPEALAEYSVSTETLR